MPPFYDQTSPKQTASIDINGDLLDQANALGIDLSSVLEGALIAIVGQKHVEQWMLENSQFLKALAARSERYAAISDEIRRC